MMEHMEGESTAQLLKETLRMAWPAVLESFFISLAGMIDTLMVSTLGTYAVAAVGLTMQPKFISLAVFLSVNVAVSALVARRRGQRDRIEANRTLLTAIWFTLAACVVITLASVLFAGAIISLCGSGPDTHDPAVTYFNIIQGGMVFNVISLVINAAQRGSGNTRIAMVTNVTSSLINVFFNYLLIGGHLGFPALGLRGAAIATVLGTAVACVLSVRSLFRANSYVSIPYILEQKILPGLEVLSSIVRFAMNLLAENVAMRIGFVYTAVIAAGLGTDAFAAHNVGMNILGLTFSLGDGMQAAAVALTGRSLGENKPEKAKRYGSLCQKTGLVIAASVSVFLFLFARPIFSLFFTEEPVIEMGVMIAGYIMIIDFFQISQVIFSGCLRGAGDVKFTMRVALISAAVIRTLVTWVFTSVVPLGLSGIWLGVFADQVSRCILFAIRFRRGDWVSLKL